MGEESETEKTTKSSRTGNDWGSILNGWIEKIEYVSAHFNYQEEYVLSHTFAWLQRKYKQAVQEQFKQQNQNAIDGMKSLLLVLDMALNKGKDLNQILPPTLEDAMKMGSNKEKINSDFVSGAWWKK